MITNHFIKTYESGIITLTINTEERWLDYHRYSDELFQVEDSQGNVFQLKVELPLQPKMRYSISHNQEKDQITYYYIPLNLVLEPHYWDKIKQLDRGL